MLEKKGTGGSSGEDGLKYGNRSDGVCVSARCSINHLFDIISGLDDKKKVLVRTIGFGGVLEYPAIRQINRRFVLWIMSRVDSLSRTLVIDESRKLCFDKTDVGKVFGIPCSGLSVADKGKPRNDVVAAIKNKYLGIGVKDNRSIKAAQEVIQRDYGLGMTEEDEKSFKAAFVIYVMATLLSPGAKFDYAGVDYWNAVVDTDRIKLYDWSEYVIQKLCDAVVKVKADLEQGNKVPSITGCTMFLQVLYLDSIDLGVLNGGHTILLRICSFNSERLKSMILADTIPGTDESGNAMYGRSKLRDPSGICYYWACSREAVAPTYSLSAVVDVWEATKKLACALRIPLEAAGPLYHGFLEYDRENRVSSPPAITAILSLISMIEPFVNGFTYNSGVELQVSDYNDEVDHRSVIGVPPHTCGPGCVLGEAGFVEALCTRCRRRDQDGHKGGSLCRTDLDCGNMRDAYKGKCIYVSKSGREPASKLDGKHYKDGKIGDNVRRQMAVTKVMSKYFLRVCDVKRRRVSSVGIGGSGPWCSDENRMCLSGETSNGVHSCSEGFGPMNESMTRLLAKVRSFDAGVLGRTPCFIHYVPKYIEVLPGPLKCQVLGSSEFEMDFFDAIVRRFKQIEDEMFCAFGGYRLRHFVEADMLESVMAGSFDVGDHSVRGQFIGSHIGYDFRSSKMVFFPAIMDHRWICYAWIVCETEIVVFDPYGEWDEGGVLKEIHMQYVKYLCSALSCLYSLIFPGWDHKIHGVSVRFLYCDEFQGKRVNHSGVLCAHFCRLFEGKDLPLGLYEMDADIGSAVLFKEVMSLVGNHGYLPREIKNWEDS